MADDERDNQSRTEEGLRNLLQRHNNDWAALAAELYSQTFQLREDRRAARAEVKSLKDQIPGEDVLILKGDAKTEYETYKAIGKPNEIQERLTAAATSQRQAAVARMAARHGFKESVLDRLLGDNEVSVEGQGDKEKFTVGGKPVDELLKSDWADFAPALQVERQTGTKAAGQAGGGREAGDTDYVAAYLKAQQPETPQKESNHGA